MKNALFSSLRTLSLAAVALSLATVATLTSAAPANAQALSIGSTINARLTPTVVPYRPGTVPSQCLAYAVPGEGPVVFCEEQFPTKYDVTVTLMFGGYKPAGFRTPDDCILRSGGPGGMYLMYCKGVHW